MKKIVLAPYIDQTERWVNGCESISAVMALGAVGVPVDPDTFIARDLPHAPFWEQDGVLWGPDPHYVYPGDPHDHTGYGCYAPCICRCPGRPGRRRCSGPGRSPSCRPCG